VISVSGNGTHECFLRREITPNNALQQCAKAHAAEHSRQVATGGEDGSQAQ